VSRQLSRVAAIAAIAVALAGGAERAGGQAADSTPKRRLNIYGFGQADIGYDLGQIDPKYPDRLRVSALPRREDQFGRDGQTYFSVRQSRFGLKGYFPTEKGEIFTVLEFDLVGSGADAGKTMPRLRHMYGEWGKFGAGQYWSPFMDVESYPTIFESFGPTGLVWIRNVQLRWIPIKTKTTRLTLAIEKPGASGEGGDYADLTELQNVQARFRTPEWVASLRRDGAWGHVQLAGLVRRMWWDDLTDDAVDLSGSATGWGVSLTPGIKFGKKDALRLQYMIGEGVENYMNDGTVDVAPEANPGDPRRPIVGKALPVQAFTGYLELYRGKWGGIAGYSAQDVENVEGQSATAFSRGDYATFTLVHYPVTNVTVLGEYQYGSRKNFENGFKANDNRIQLSIRYDYGADIRGQ
jgi:hypothetical protein